MNTLKTFAATTILISSALTINAQNRWTLVWNEEFNYDGRLSAKTWNYENGFVRNHEDQWYQQDNAWCENGCLVIEARKEKRDNPTYTEGSNEWRKKRKYIEYTSASVNTAGKKDFLYGRIEVRAKIPTASGAWPAIWMLGNELEWPSNGEIDIMEYYQFENAPHIMANAAWGSDKRFNAIWNTKRVPFSYFTAKDKDWADKFHIWRMDWDSTAIKIYLDDELINDIPLNTTINGKAAGNGINPFTRPQYILLNLALGGDNGGKIDDAAMPMRYLIDYVRVYQMK